MSMRIPSDAKLVRDSRLTLIRVISTLSDRLVNGDDGLKARVKRTMLDKDARFAESDLVVAALRAGASRSTIDPRRLYQLVEAGELTLGQFLECVSVVKKPLEQYLPGQTIDQLCTPGPAAEPALFTEFKEGIEIDLDDLATTLTGAISSAVR